MLTLPAVPEDMLFFAARALLLAVAMIIFAVTLSRWRRATVRGHDAVAASLDLARGELQGLRALAEVLVQRVGELEEQVSARAQLGAAAAPTAAGYDVALRLARSGSAVDEIVATSGVTRQEAQLLARLHGPASRAQAQEATTE